MSMEQTKRGGRKRGRFKGRKVEREFFICNFNWHIHVGGGVAVFWTLSRVQWQIEDPYGPFLVQRSK